MRGYSAICLIGTKTDVNVGGALRAAHCYHSSLVFLQNFRGQKSPSDTTKAARHLPVIQTSDVFSITPEECETVAVEFIPSARSLVGFTHPERALYVFGPENGSIPDDILVKCNHVVYVPTLYCMNLAATVNVVLYDRMVKKHPQWLGNADNPLEMELEANSGSHEDKQLVNPERTGKPTEV